MSGFVCFSLDIVVDVACNAIGLCSTARLGFPFSVSFQFGFVSVSSDLSDKAVHMLAGDFDGVLIFTLSTDWDHAFNGEGRFIVNVDAALSFLESLTRDERDMGESS